MPNIVPELRRPERRELIRLGRKSGDPDTANRFSAVAKLAAPAPPSKSHVARELEVAISTVVSAARRFIEDLFRVFVEDPGQLPDAFRDRVPVEGPHPVVRDYIAGRPSVVDAMRAGIVNHSALARLVCRELGIRSEEAVLAACRRFPLAKAKGFREEAVKRVLQKSRIETRTRIAAITVSQGVDVLQRLGDVVEELLDENRICRLIQVSQGTVIVVDETSASRVTRKLREAQILGVRRNLVEITATSPESVEARLENFPKYVRRQHLKRFLAFYEIFKLALPVKGSIVECGVFRGFGLISKVA